MKRYLKGLLLICLIALMTFPGYTENKSISQKTASKIPLLSDKVNLIYYTIGTPGNDLPEVNEKLNKLLLDKIGITVSYYIIPWDNYEATLESLVNTGKTFDIAYTGNAAIFAQYAQKGAWLMIDEYLETTGNDMYNVIDPVFWEGVTINGHIFGVPTNKELAVLDQWMFPEELINKYHIDLNEYTTLESLEPLFSMIQENEEDYLVMELDSKAHNYFTLLGYEYLVDRSLPLVVKSVSDDHKILNPFETQECIDLLYTIRKYYEAGYINEDASIKPSSELEKDKKVFFKIASGGPYAESIWSQDRNYNIVTVYDKSQKVVTTESTRAGVMSISAATEHPDESIAFLNLINTDAEVRNLLQYGIEGVHYSLTEEDQVEIIDDFGYKGVQYTQGNWFILKTLDGDPTDKWDVYREFNSDTTKSSILGFTPDFSDLTEEVSSVNEVVEKYYSAIITGTVDLDINLPKFNAALKEAGIEKIQTVLQNQLDAWLLDKEADI